MGNPNKKVLLSAALSVQVFGGSSQDVLHHLNHVEELHYFVAVLAVSDKLACSEFILF